MLFFIKKNSVVNKKRKKDKTTGRTKQGKADTDSVESSWTTETCSTSSSSNTSLVDTSEDFCCTVEPVVESSSSCCLQNIHEEQQQPEQGPRRASLGTDRRLPQHAAFSLFRQHNQKTTTRQPKRGSTGTCHAVHLRPLKSCLVVRTCSPDGNVSEMVDSISVLPPQSPKRVQIKECNNTVHPRTLPTLTIEEQQLQWYHKDDLVEQDYHQMLLSREQQDRLSEEMIYCLALLYRDCCMGKNFSVARIQALKEVVLDCGACTGQERLVLDSLVPEMVHDKELRRAKRLELVMEYNRQVQTKGYILERAQRLSDKCQFIAQPAKLFAQALGQAHALQVHPEQKAKR